MSPEIFLPQQIKNLLLLLSKARLGQAQIFVQVYPTGST